MVLYITHHKADQQVQLSGALENCSMWLANFLNICFQNESSTHEFFGAVPIDLIEYGQLLSRCFHIEANFYILSALDRAAALIR